MAEDNGQRSDVERLREAEAEKLTICQNAIWSKVKAGSLEAIKVYLLIAARRSRLLGLDLTKEVVNAIAAIQDQSSTKVLIAVAGKRPRPIEELTDQELETYALDLEGQLEGAG